MLSKPRWQYRAIPLSFHGDAVPCMRVGKAGSDSFDAYSWQGLLGAGSTLFLKQYLFGLFTAMVTANTMAPIWAEVLWSFQWLAEGTWPTGPRECGFDWFYVFPVRLYVFQCLFVCCFHLCAFHFLCFGRGLYDPRSADGILAGTDLAAGFFAVIFLLKGDIKHFGDAYGLRKHNNLFPCDFCPCHRNDDGDTGYFVFNFNYDAAWKTSLYTKAEWRALYPMLHPIFSGAFSYITQENVEPDELHVMHLGVGKELLGSALWWLVFVMMAGEAATNVCRIWESYSSSISKGTNTFAIRAVRAAVVRPRQWQKRLSVFEG